MREFAPVLDECIAGMFSGQTVEACLARHPEFAAELRPLLMVADILGKIEQPALSTHRRLVIDRRLRLAAHSRQRTPLRLGNWAIPLVRLTAAAVVILVICLGGVMWTSEAAMPGEVLYPVKRTGEELSLALALTPARRTGIRLDLALERMTEVVTIVERTGSLPEHTLRESVQTSQTAVAECPPSPSLLLRAQVAVDVQQAQLQKLVPILTAGDRQTARAALRKFADMQAELSAQIHLMNIPDTSTVPAIAGGKPAEGDKPAMASFTPTATRRPVITATPAAAAGTVYPVSATPTPTHLLHPSPTPFPSLTALASTPFVPPTPATFVVLRPSRTPLPTSTPPVFWPTRTPRPTATPIRTAWWPTWTPWPTKVVTYVPCLTPTISWPLPYPTRQYFPHRLDFPEGDSIPVDDSPRLGSTWLIR